MNVSFHPAGWLWLLALPALLLLLASRRARPYRQVVSSHLLFRDLPDASSLGLRSARRAPPVSLLLSLLILAGLALAAAGPWLVPAGNARPLAVIVDGSASMAALAGGAGRRRIDTAREVALRLLRESDASSYRLVVASGQELRTAQAGPGESEPLEAALRDLSPGHGAAPLGSLTATAAALLASRGGGRVVVISDFAGSRLRPLEHTTDRVTLEAVAVGGPSVHRAVPSPAERPDGVVRLSIQVHADGPLPGELAAALPLFHRGDGETGVVHLFVGRLPQDLPPRWIFLPLREPGAGTPRPTGALDIVATDVDFLERFHPVLARPLVSPPPQPPRGATTLAVLGGETAVALHQAKDSVGIWWGIPLETTDLPSRGVLPLVLSGMLRRLAGDTHGVTAHAGLTPSPPPFAVTAESVLARADPAPRSLRGGILGLVLVLLVLEAGVRLRGGLRRSGVPRRARVGRELVGSEAGAGGGVR